MEAFRQRGDQVGLYCVDSVLCDSDKVLNQIKESGYPYFNLSEVNYNHESHWMVEWLSRKNLARSLAHDWTNKKIDCLIIGSAFGPARQTIIHTAIMVGIPIVQIIDGLIVPTAIQPIQFLKRRRLNMALLRMVYRNIRIWLTSKTCYPDLYLIMNHSGRKQLIQSGIPEHKIKIVGSPVLETLARTYLRLPAIAKPLLLINRLELPTERSIVFFAAQETLEYDHKLIISDLLPAIKESHSILLVKFHPRDPVDLEEWRNWAKRKGFGSDEIRFYRNELTSIEALLLSDVCVTYFSTVAIEAMIIGKPMVYIQYIDVTNYTMPYASQYEAGIDAHSKEELKTAIIKLLMNEELRQRVIENGYIAVTEELNGLDGSINLTLKEISHLISNYHHKTTYNHHSNRT